MTRAVCIGECMVELRPAGGDSLLRTFAGDAYNTAVYLKRSSPGVRVQFATCTGEDPLSAAMRDAWRAESIDPALAFTVPGRQPGLYLIQTAPDGDRRFHYWRGESAARGWLQSLLANGGAKAMAGADLVYLSGISLAILSPEDRLSALELMASLRGRVALIAFDPNFRPQLWASRAAARDALEQAIAAADVVLPSCDDLKDLFCLADPLEQMQRLVDQGCREVALTAGPGLCLVHDGVTREVSASAAKTVVDTSGAGDSFNGAYLAARLAGRSVDDAARSGLALAAEVVSHTGAISPRSLQSKGR